MFELDQYYTPEEVAIDAIESGSQMEPSVCVDSTCGSGNLLSAAESVFANIDCIGVDKDRNIIKSLKRKNPSWTLSSADMLQPSSYKKTLAYSYSSDCDLLLLNPPFSHGNRKSIPVEYMGTMQKCSVAMAYVLHSFNAFRPQHGAIIIVPESVLYSDTDKSARQALSRNYATQIIKELHCTTFRGTRARATVIRLAPEPKPRSIPFTEGHLPFKRRVEIVRGGLPVHQMNEAKTGIPFIHTTAMSQLKYKVDDTLLHLTPPFTRGIINGHFVLLPRVGVPIRNHLRPHYSKGDIQLSDCVIAIRCRTKNEARETARLLKDYWDNLELLYRGTGARYITVERLGNFLHSIGINASH